MIRQFVLMFALLFAGAASAAPIVTSVTAQQRYPWNGLVDIVVTIQGELNDVAQADCSFAATNSATKAAIPVEHITRNGDDTGSGTSWTRKFVWNAKADVGEVKIEDVELTVVVDLSLGGVQLWEGGPYWAECNVGATKPEDYGYYFWWGGTVGYVRNSFDNKWISVADNSVYHLFAKGCPTYGLDGAQLQLQGYISGTGNLSPEFDAATTDLNMPWRMPTDAEWAAVISNCTTTWSTRNGVNGLLVMGKGTYASRSIFLPAGGYGYLDYRNSFNGGGYYWSSAPYSENTHYAWGVVFTSTDFRRNYDCPRDTGRSVRPLRDVDVADLLVEGMATTHLALDFRVQPLPQGGPYTETVDGVEWTFMVNADLNASVGSGSYESSAVPSGTSGEITIPSTLGGRSVTSIGYSAFSYCGALTSVTMPEGVTSIGSEAFSDCTNLALVKLPKNLNQLADDAFSRTPYQAGLNAKLALLAEFGGTSQQSTSVALTTTNVVVHYVLNGIVPETVTPTIDNALVAIYTEVKGDAVAIPQSWAEQFPQFKEKFGTDFVKALTMETGKKGAGGAPMLVWHDFVAGTDPTNPEDTFKASITFDKETGKPIISWTPEVKDESGKYLRKYTVYGKAKLTDEQWEVVPEGREDDYNFFKVTVEML